ncbi:MAG: AAA family ATPase [Herpetosiphon sp.]
MVVSDEGKRAFAAAGVAGRWRAIQEFVHPALLQLAEEVEAAAPTVVHAAWPMYEVSWKQARFLNRGQGRRDPITEYHFAIDRPPRGAGLYVGVSGEEQAVLAGIAVSGKRKAALHSVWETGRPVWEPLIAHLNEVRFAGATSAGPVKAVDQIEQYLNDRQALYLWAGYRFAWDGVEVADPGFRAQLVGSILELLGLLEAVMDRAEGAGRDVEVREATVPYRLGGVEPDIQQIIARIAARGFAYADDIVRAYHVALGTKPLVILPGIAGTGKTRLTRLYADAMHGIGAEQDNQFYLLVAVQPDWHNAKDLLGYYNALTGTFHATALLRLLLRAVEDPDQHFYVCLDEMNLARPEYYLAPLLSAMETADRLIDLNTPGPTVRTTEGMNIRSPFALPSNVAFTGTVNIDEAAFGLSDKVLDRANVIELRNVDLQRFRQMRSAPVNEQAWAVLVAVHHELATAGLAFGYRTLDDVLRYVELSHEIMPVLQALDLQLVQKVLTKVRGEDTPRFRKALDGLRRVFQGDGDEAPRFPQASGKVQRMIERLNGEGYTDFYV